MNLDDKVIMVTGGTGSFGQKFTEIALRKYSPRKLIIFSRDEHKQSEMQHRFSSPALRYFVGDVRDTDRLHRAMRGVNVVVHAAALKQVPSCEYNPFEAIKTNILGAANVIDAAIDAGVDRVIGLSTDKAVNPVNLYGATKLCAEKLFVQGNSYAGLGGTKMSCARYGNVVASRGSVVPLFLEQRTNGVVTVTDPRMTRFWITLEQGVEFVLSCLERMRGGEVFVPKIPSMNIMDLVQAVAPECRVEVTGIRPGEKLHELLISADEAHHTLEFPDIFVIQPLHPWWKTDNAAEPFANGRPLDDGFVYSSDQNGQRLTPPMLREIVTRL